MRDGGTESAISMRPWPTSLLPSHASLAPLPLFAPKVRFIAGSFFSHGDQAPQRSKSLMSAKTFSGGALMLAERSTRNVSGRVAARISTPAMRMATMMPIVLNTVPPLCPCLMARVGPLEPRDIELLHLQQFLHDALRFALVLVLQHPGELRGHDLPRDPVAVLEPAALLRLGVPAFPELFPVLVELRLCLAENLEGDGFVEPEQ